MRAFVFLLIFANLLFFAWTQGLFGSPSGPDAQRIKQQLQADRVTIVSRDVPPETPATTSKAVPVAEIKSASLCLQVSDLKVDDAARFESELSGKLNDFKAVRTLVEGAPSFWVYIPPQDSKREAEKKAAELKDLKIKDYFIIQEEGPNRYAVSLGVFSSQAAADEHLGKLRKKGVRSAKAGLRSVRPSSALLEITGPESQSEALKKLLAEVLPESKPTACKTQPAAG